MKNKIKLEMRKRGNLLVSSEQIYSKIGMNNQILYLNISPISSKVVKTLTKDCCLRCRSLDQIAAFVNRANAKKSISSGSDIKSAAFSKKSSYFDDSKKSIDSSTSFCLILNSCSDRCDFNKHSDLCFLISDLKNSGAKKFILIDENKYELIDAGFIREKKILLSNTNLILLYFRDLPLFETNLSNFSLISGDTSESNLLNLSLLALLPNSTDHSINSCSSLDSSLSNSLFLVINSSLIMSDQFTQDNAFISDLTLSGIANVTDAIYSSPLSTICSNFFNCSILRMIILLNISDHLISGCASILFFISSGIDNVTVAILVSPINYVNTQKYVKVYKSFGFLSRTNESNSYSNAMSNRTKWQNLSSVSGAAVVLLNYSAKTDSAALNIRTKVPIPPEKIEVPPNEPAGIKQSNLTFTAELTSISER